MSILLAWIQYDAFILPRLDILQGLVEVLLAGLYRSRVLLVTRQVGVNQLNEPV